MADSFFKIRNGVNFGSLASDPSNPQNGDVYYNTTLQSFRRFQNGAWGAFGSGTGSGGINYLATPTDSSDFETDTGNWVAYQNTAQVQPVNGTGGSPVTTITRTTSSPLRGNGSGLITKDAANRQGEGVSVNFTIDNADEAKLLSVQFDYIIASGSFNAGSPSADSDLEVWVYDVTNAVLIPVTPLKLVSNSSVTPATFKGVFQTNSNSTSYRLILHIATTNASAWTFKFDNVSVGPQAILNAPSISDWITYTPIISGFGTVSSVMFESRRVGDTLEVKGHFTSGTPTATPAQITIGYNGANANVVVDDSKVAGNTLVGYGALGSTALNTIGILSPSSNQNFVGMSSGQDGVTQNPLATANGNQVATVGLDIQLFFAVPILGWSSNTVTGNDADARVVSARYSQTSGQSITNSVITIVNFDTETFDTHAAVTTGGSWKFTAPVSGKYQVDAACILTGMVNTNVTMDMYIFKNGSIYSHSISINVTPASGFKIKDEIDLLAGDFIDIRVQQNDTAARSLSTTAGDNHVSIAKVSGPALPLATETVVARYSGANSQSLSTGGTVVNFDVKVIDTHGAVTTGVSWKFTAPISGNYNVSADIHLDNLTAGTDQFYRIRKNGSNYKVIIDRAANDGGASHDRQFYINAIVPMVAGDFIDTLVTPDNNSAVTDGTTDIHGINIFLIK